MRIPSIKKTWLAFWVGGFLGVGMSIFVNQFFVAHNTVTAEIEPNVAYTLALNYSNKNDLWHQALPATTLHIETPEKVRGVYLSSWSAGLQTKIDSTIDFIKKTNNLNTVIIDIKDSTGYISYKGTNPTISTMGSYTNRIRNIEQIIRKFHKNDIYVIGRVTAFEDPYIAGKKDKFVMRTLKGEPWYNHKSKRNWIDPSNQEYREYLVSIAREAYALGFDEINFDYIRYPSEGPINDIFIPDTKSKIDVITDFVQFLNDELREKDGIIISADVFGLTTTNTTDFGIGQVWENILPNVDYLCPMVYPSHYAPGAFGFDNPAEYPFEILTASINGAVKKTEAMGESISKIRPWIQDFDLGATYNEREVREQLEAIENIGVNSYLVWDPRNIYTQSAYTLLP